MEVLKQHKNFEFINLDIQDKDALEKVFKKI